uniref:Transposase n=1 Tax=Ascaris lumbricoides TaxID=6252 RepID=A0A0M3HF87_ASCLU
MACTIAYNDIPAGHTLTLLLHRIALTETTLSYMSINHSLFGRAHSVAVWLWRVENPPVGGCAQCAERAQGRTENADEADWARIVFDASVVLTAKEPMRRRHSDTNIGRTVDGMPWRRLSESTARDLGFLIISRPGSAAMTAPHASLKRKKRDVLHVSEQL